MVSDNRTRKGQWMNPILELFLIVIAWGNLWVMPASIAGSRRAKKKPTYIPFFLSILVIEVLMAVGFMYINGITLEIDAAAWISPLTASSIASFIYWFLAERKDKETVNC